MDPSDADTNARKERDETDASLRAERGITDAELTKARTAAEEDADNIVDVARERAEEVLRGARERADRDLTRAGAAADVRKEVAVERAAEDGVATAERAAADERLRHEREEHRRALSKLLRLEREATDDGLLVERSHADAVVATRDDFLGMVSHDLRSMLGTIAISASLLAKHAVASGVGGTGGDVVTMKHAERIQRSIARMNRLVGDLLDVVSLEAGMLHVTPAPLDAIDLAKEAVEAFQPSFGVQGITLIRSSSSAAGPILGTFDHERILQVLANLLSNALKFTDHGGTVTLSIARAGAEVCFTVTDTGVGIPAGQETAIFERFRQVGTRDRRGLGLGLYIAKCIVDAHGGRIWAESPKAGGTAIYFTVPAVKTADAA